MPSRRKQTVGSCQLARGHRRSAPCGGARHLTEGSSSLSSLQTVPGSPRRRPPTINPPWCCSSLDAARTLTVSTERQRFDAVTGAVGTKRDGDGSQRPSVDCALCVFGVVALWESSMWLCVLFSEVFSCFIRFAHYYSRIVSFQLMMCVSTRLATCRQQIRVKVSIDKFKEKKIK